MRISHHTDLGLRVLMLCTLDRPVSREWLAERLEASVGGVKKVVADLGRAGFLQTVRGPHGGVRLGRPAEALMIGAVIRCLERTELVACMRGENCTVSGGCRLSEALDHAVEQFFCALDGVSLAEVRHLPELVQISERA